MNLFTSIFQTFRRADEANRSWTKEIGRKLRTFDIETIAPYDHAGLVGFLKADKLSDLSPNQIRIFLMLRDNPDPRGYSVHEIAEQLELSRKATRACLRVLKQKGYATLSLSLAMTGPCSGGGRGCTIRTTCGPTTTCSTGSLARSEPRY